MSYQSNVSRFKQFYRGVFAQMILFGALSFVGPALADAITNLGGGGLSSPYLANLVNSFHYISGCLMTLLGGPLINKLGIKKSCVIAAIGMPLVGSSYYSNARYGVIWYLVIAQMIGGLTGGFLYVAEATAMLSYPQPEDRGFYLGIWSAMRNSGSIFGGAINFAKNHSNSTTGGIAPSTYLIFFLIACVTVPLVVAYGRYLLDLNEWSQRRRAKIAVLTWIVPQVICFTWIGFENRRFGRGMPVLDYNQNPDEWTLAIFPLIILFIGGCLTQLSLYWIIGILSENISATSQLGGLFRAFEMAGQATSYAMNAQKVQMVPHNPPTRYEIIDSDEERELSEII